MSVLDKIKRDITAVSRSIFFRLDFDPTMGARGLYRAHSEEHGITTYGPTMELALASARSEFVARALHAGSADRVLSASQESLSKTENGDRG